MLHSYLCNLKNLLISSTTVILLVSSLIAASDEIKTQNSGESSKNGASQQDPHAPLTHQRIQYDGCGELPNAMGPYDYRIATTEPGREKSILRNMEKRYWTTAVRTFRKAGFSTDINTLLRTFPNHHPVLYIAAKLSLLKRENSIYHGPLESWPMTFACYMDRAIRFKPDDGVTWMIWGVYLHKDKQYKKAAEKYVRALELEVKSSELHYNLGLAYMKLDNLSKASEQAKLAYEMGYPLFGLKENL